jgi:Potential Queuosine, Q, salvage protein family
MQQAEDRSETSVPDRVRAACAWVAARAHSAWIKEGTIGAYAAGLPPAGEDPSPDPATPPIQAEIESQAALVICLDAINFGSGWWPTIRKRAGHSGYFTIAAGLTERFREKGAWEATDLVDLRPVDLAEVLGQDPEHPLMAEYAASLRDVGEHVLADHGGRFEGVIDAAHGSAVGLAGLLANWSAFADSSTYGGREVPFYKRAQITAADLNRAGVADLRDEERLTAFADNLVPHVLRVDGVLGLDSSLEETIEAGTLLIQGSSEEVELRACAVHAIELLAAASELSPAEIDAVLWNRGRAERYKSIPRPRSRNTAY